MAVFKKVTNFERLYSLIQIILSTHESMTYTSFQLFIELYEDVSTGYLHNNHSYQSSRLN